MSVHNYMSAEELEVQPVGFPFDVPGLYSLCLCLTLLLRLISLLLLTLAL